MCTHRTYLLSVESNRFAKIVAANAVPLDAYYYMARILAAYKANFCSSYQSVKKFLAIFFDCLFFSLTFR